MKENEKRKKSKKKCIINSGIKYIILIFNIPLQGYTHSKTLILPVDEDST